MAKTNSTIEKIINGFKNSAATVNKINKENLAEEKRAFKKRHTQVTESNPDIAKVREAKGFKNKLKAIGENIKQSAKENSEKEKQRREKILSHESYKNLMQIQREWREIIINRD